MTAPVIRILTSTVAIVILLLSLDDRLLRQHQPPGFPLELTLWRSVLQRRAWSREVEGDSKVTQREAETELEPRSIWRQATGLPATKKKTTA